MKYIPSCKEEAEMIANYDPSKYKNPAIAVDAAIFAYDKEIKKLKLLLIERGGFPYRGCYALPGGFCDVGEHIHEAVKREVLEETGLKDIYMELYYCLGAPDRDPRYHVVTPEYIALTDIAKVKPKAGDDAAKAEWFTVMRFDTQKSEKKNEKGERVVTLRHEILLSGSTELKTVTTEKITYSDIKKTEVEITDTAGMAFDHSKAVFYALRHLKNRLQTSDIAYNVFSGRFKEEELKAFYGAAFAEYGEVPGLAKNGEYCAFED